MPDIEKTWYTIANFAVSGGSNPVYKQRMAFNLKESLTGAVSARNPSDIVVALGALAAQVVESSDSATVDTSDLLTMSSVFVWDTAGSAHSWYVLEIADFYAVGQSQFMLFDCRGTNEGVAYISFSRNAYTGGTINDAPTAVDEVVVKDGVTSVGNLATSDAWDAEDLVSTSGVLHVQISTDGEIYRWFMCRGGVCHTFAGFQRSQTSPASGMTNDAVFWWLSSAVDADALQFESAQLKGLAGFYFVDNSDVVQLAQITCPVIDGSNNPITDQTANGHDNSRFLPRAFLYATTPIGVPSVMTDLYWASSSDATGSKAPSTNEILAQVGSMMTPWPLNRVYTST